MEFENYLEHHGILGQRWGVRRYQNEDGSLTKAGAQRYGSSENDDRRSKAEAASAKGDKKNITKYMDTLSTTELEDAKKRAQIRSDLDTKKETEEKKEKKSKAELRAVINSGDKELVKQYANKMTATELEEAMKKINLMSEINKVEPTKSAWDKIDEAMYRVNQVSNWMDAGFKAYKNASKIYSAINHLETPDFDGNNKDSKKDNKDSKKDNKKDNDSSIRPETKTVLAKIATDIYNDARQTHAENLRAEHAKELQKRQYKHEEKMQKRQQEYETKQNAMKYKNKRNKRRHELNMAYYNDRW